MNTPDGNPLSLQSLRGKVVLIDFWASWCGPCRRENPHVVAAYQQYHGKGFDVLGVSLDKTKDRWLAAIEKDGLIWHHVSDLKGWQNAAAQLYGVRSIPHTVLLDREGKIIARGLRGAALTAKLDELFGG
jgi:thiol-disulfide isomerase/thioredoxin